MEHTNPIFELNDVQVKYGLRKAVDGLNLSLTGPGIALGLLGQNGAGKSSTLRVLLGLVRAKKGTVQVLGGAPGREGTLRDIGYAPEDGAPPEYLSVREYLGMMAKLRGASTAQMEDLMAWFELEPKKKIKDLSKGNVRRVVLAQAFLGDPKLLVLDEPLNGLDPLFILKLRDRLQAVLKTGTSLLYSSHILTEVERVCGEIAILNDGKLVCREKTETLVQAHGSIEGAFSAKVGGK